MAHMLGPCHTHMEDLEEFLAPGCGLSWLQLVVTIGRVKEQVEDLSPSAFQKKKKSSGVLLHSREKINNVNLLDRSPIKKT